jgi:hypothetical protein
MLSSITSVLAKGKYDKVDEMTLFKTLFHNEVGRN